MNLGVLVSVFPTLLVAVTLSLPVLSDDGPLPTFSAEYSVSRTGFNIADTKYVLSKINDETYIFESLSEPAGFLSLFKKGKITESNTLAATDNLFRPINYQYRIKNKRKGTNYITEFDWAKNIVKINDNGHIESLTIPSNTLNRFTLQLMIMYDLSHNKQDIEYVVLRKHKLETFVFARAGTETIETPAGSFETQIIEGKKKDGSSSRTMTLWCAPKLHYLPVQIIQNKNDKALYIMSLKSVTGL